MYNVIYLHLVYIFGEYSMYIPVCDIREQIYRYNSLKQLLLFRLLLSHTLSERKENNILISNLTTPTQI